MSVVANVAINVDSRGATQKLREVQNQAQQTERAFGGLANSVGQLVKAYAAFQAVKFVFTQAAEIQSQTRSLEVLTGSVQKATQIVKQLQDLGAVTPFTSSELIDAAKRLQAFGVETNKVVDTTRRLADVSGATGAELQGLVTAYGQVQAKGRLQGEELLQFQERGVALQKILKDEYKLSGDEFQKALEGGRISAQAVEAAIIKLTDAGGKYANGAIAQSDTLNGKLSTLQDSFQRLAQNIGTFFEPVFKFLIDGVNALIERLNNASRIGAEARAYEEANRRTRTRFGALRYANPFDQEVQQYRERLRRSLVTSEMGTGAAATAPRMTGGGSLPSLLAPRGGAGGEGRSGISDAAREAERLKKELEQSLKVGDQLGTQFSRQVVLLDESSELERKRLQIQFDFEDRSKQIGELKNAEQRVNLTDLNNEIRRLETLKLQTEELKKQLEEYYKRAGLTPGAMLPGGAGAFRTDINLMPETGMAEEAAKVKKELDDLLNPINQVKEAAKSIGEAFGTSFKGLVSGAMTAQEALAGFFRSVADHFLDMAAQIIAKWIQMTILNSVLKLFPGGPATGAAASGGYTLPGGAGFAEGFSLPSLLPGRAAGGPVSAGSPYIVGEKGPELFVPGKSGSIVPNNKLGSSGSTNVVVNVDASGSKVQGDDPKASQLGSALAAAVQAEIIKQKKPGGLLY